MFLFMNERKGKKKSLADVYAKQSFYSWKREKPVLISIHNLVEFIRKKFIQPLQTQSSTAAMVFTLYLTRQCPMTNRPFHLERRLLEPLFTSRCIQAREFPHDGTLWGLMTMKEIIGKSIITGPRGCTLWMTMMKLFSQLTVFASRCLRPFPSNILFLMKLWHFDF